MKVNIENMLGFGIPVVVTINKFTDDKPEETELVRKFALDNSASFAVPIDPWAKGGDGCIEAAESVVRACELPNNFHFLYPDDASIEEKIETICRKIYRADGVDYSPQAKKRIKLYTKLGYGKLPINMAKTHLSLSHDPNLKGAPKGFRVPVRDIRASVGAGFLYPLLGAMRTMPGLPSHPAFMDVDIDKDGKTLGLF